MGTKQNQHYVPKFYLRNFSVQGNKKQIGLFNTNTSFYYEKASIKNQASKPFFYGKDLVIENKLGLLEAEYSKLIGQVCSTKQLPPTNSWDYIFLLQFIILTSIRNPVQSETSQESFQKLINILGRKGKIGKELNNTISDIKELRKFPFQQVIPLTEICMDLNCKIVNNITSTPFITSDNPVVKYNQYLEKKVHHGSITGFGAMGLQLFVPLNPSTLLIAYDKGIYKVGTRKQKLIELSNTSDVDALNMLQFVNCYQNTYFNHDISQEYLIQTKASTDRFPKANIGMAEEHPVANEQGEIIENRTISVMYSTDCKTKLELGFVKETSAAKSQRLTNHAVQLRKNAELVHKKYSP